MDKIFSTRFQELGFTHVTGTQVDAGSHRQISEWRFVDLAADHPALVGASYPTRELLVAALPAYAAEFGCEGATKADAMHDAYNAAFDADNAWMAELHRVYGSFASMARYDERGVATPRLKELHDIWRVAEDARHALAQRRCDV